MCIVQGRTQESSWLIHHLPYGARGSTVSHTLPGRGLHTGQAHICELLQGATYWFHLLYGVFRGRWQRAPAELTVLFSGKRNLLHDTSTKSFVPKSHVHPASSLVGPALDFGKHCITLLHADCLIPVPVPPWRSTRGRQSNYTQQY